MGSCEIPVMITSKEVVAPLCDHPTTATSLRLPFSNLDYFYPDNVHVSVYFCYAKPNDSKYDHHSMVGVLRESLAGTLSAFPVFAGEVVANAAGEPESLLSDCSVDFFRASSTMGLGDLDLFHPDVSVRDCLVPNIRQGVLAVKVTELICGGLVVGITFDHRVADTYSANMFLVSWSETALRGHPTSYAPIIDRSLLRPSSQHRHHNHNTTSGSSVLDKWYTPLPREEPPSLPDGVKPADEHTSRTFYVEAGTLKGLQEKASLKNGCKEGLRTKYEAFTAFLWQLLANSATNAAATFKVSIPVDGRTRMYAGKSTQNAAFMHHYFGNAVSYPFTEASAGSLRAMPLSDAAGLIRRCKAEATKPEHFSEVVDWVEGRRPMMPGVRAVFEEEAVMVSSGQRLPVAEVEFGWGKPAFASYYFPWAAPAGYVMPMPSAAREGDWVIFMYLRRRHMEVVEKDGGHVFKPLVASYLNLPSS